MQKEAKARLKINEMLMEAGWRFFEDESGAANIVVEPNVKMTRKQIDDMGEDFEKSVNGFVDFLLLDENNRPFIVLEAKSEDKDPLVGKEQAREYAKNLYVKFVILSNGNINYFWNIERGNPQLITAFPSYDSLKSSKAFTTDPKKLFGEKIGIDYIAITQMSTYDRDPQYVNPDTRQDFIKDHGLRFLRNYQMRAVEALQKSAKKGNTRFLFEMATGTGKTLVSAAVIKLFLRTGNAKRVLFLVDRLELETQAQKNFRDYLKNDYTTLIFKVHRDDWKKADIVVTTVQSLLYNNKYRRLFKPTDFDLVISDEAHRSISGNARAVFEYFLGYKLGLTATPKDYIKNVDIEKLKVTDPRAWEKRQLLDSYRTFGCESGDPTFRYSLIDGVNDKDGPFLVNPTVVDARTDITTQLLSDDGYAIVRKSGEYDDEDEEETFFGRNFERTFFSENTNRMFCKAFIQNALKDPLSQEIGKTIVFCVSRKHAAKITNILNEFADNIWPGKYNSDFAMQITSDVTNVQTYTVNFQNNNLSGHTSFLENYKSSKTRVCVTVGMMTTGYDCTDLLNVVLMRPIFSPSDFVQIKGRGIRICDFKYTYLQNGQIETICQPKTTFKLFDFFGNCEYFEEDFNYDEVVELPQRQSNKGDGKTEGGQSESFDEPYESFEPDDIRFMTETAIGTEGMKIDRKLYEKFEETVRQDEYVQQQVSDGNFTAAEQYVVQELFDKPDDYINMDKLRRAINVDRRVNLREILEKAFGFIPGFKTKHELVEDEFAQFQQTCPIPSDKFYDVKNFFEVYLTDKYVRRVFEDRNPQLLADSPTFSMGDLKTLGTVNAKKIIDYVSDHVNVNRFAS
jgi:type I restriction enzyme R subunit